MIRALLDHPWPLEATLDANSKGFRVLENFSKLVSDWDMEPVRFIGNTEYEQLWLRIGGSVPLASGLAAVKRFVEPLIRYRDGHCRAVPYQAPADLSEDWKCALREATVGTGWRNPQIVVADKRRQDWPTGEEVEIRFDPCDNEPPLLPERRVLVTLDSYEKHRFARSDFDPWELQRTHPPSESAPLHLQHPCWLPKPRPLEHAPLSDLNAALVKARSWGWRSRGKYYFIPGEDWNCETVTKETWRNGRPFPHGRWQQNNRSGYVDFEGRVWVWDETHRHWDVQTTDGYIKVSHTGDSL
jgi:hypothetical protein